MEITTKSAQETQSLGQKIGSDLKSGRVIALTGSLGAGKTTFVQGLALGLGIKDRVISPTFILMRNYAGDLNLFHLDMYRLEDKFDDEVKNLGLSDIWSRKENVVVIEWAEKIKDLLPENTVWINIENLGEDKRKFRFQ